MIGSALAAALIFVKANLWIETLLLTAALSLLLPGLQFFVLYAFISLPAAALLAVMVFERFCGLEENLKSLKLMAALGGLVFMLSWPHFYAALETLAAGGGSGMLSRAAFICLIASSTVFCGFVSACAIMLFSLLFELPVRWLSGVASLRPGFPWPAFRLLSGVSCVALAVNLLAGFIAGETDPLSFIVGGL